MKDLLQMAAVQKLCEFLGYDEGKFYFALLNRKEIHDYSHSKSYRLLKSLYDLGAVAKVRDVKKEREFSSYVPLPPTFLYNLKETAIKEIITYLEKIYLKNFPALFLNNYLELSFSYGFQLPLFLIRHYMKQYAIIVFGSDDDYSLYETYLSPENFKKITYICRKDYAHGVKGKIIAAEPCLVGGRRVVIIDGIILLDFLRFPKEDAAKNPRGTRYYGYLLSKDLIENPRKLGHVKRVEQEIRELFHLH